MKYRVHFRKVEEFNGSEVVEADSPTEAYRKGREVLEAGKVFWDGARCVYATAESAFEIVESRRADAVCEICKGKGYVVSQRSEDGREAVERCDTCEVFASDPAAAKAAAGDGVDCEPDYPCYVRPA